jgi:cell division protein FtsA
MQKDQIVVGLDIGTTKICAMVGRLNEHGRLEILAVGKAPSEGVIRGQIANLEKTKQGIEKAIKEASDLADVDIKVVKVGISGHNIRSSQTESFIVRENKDVEINWNDVERLTQDIHRTVMPAGFQLIHAMPQSFTLDGEVGITNPIGHSGVKLGAKYHLVMAETEVVNKIHKCVKGSSLFANELILEPIASSLAVLTNEEKDQGVALVDIGGGTTDLAIYENGILVYSSVIPYGGNIITNDIKQGCVLMQAQAEQLKTRFGYALTEEADENTIVSLKGLRGRPPKEISVKQLSYIIQSRMEEIIEFILAEIHHAGHLNKIPAGIVLTGGGAKLNGLSSLFQVCSGMDVRIGYPNEYLGKSKFEDAKNPIYSTVIGLMLAGFHTIDERFKEHHLPEESEVKTVIDNGSPIIAIWDRFKRQTTTFLQEDINSGTDFKN